MADAARAAGLPGLVVGMLETGVAAGGEVPEVLRFLSRYYRARFSRAMAVVRGAVVPATVLAFAAPVLWIALSLFVPMVAMVEKLTADVGRMRP